MENNNSSSKFSAISFASYIFLPILFIYDEVFLRIFCGIPVLANLQYPILFGISSGAFLTAIISLLPKKAETIVKTATGSIITVIYIAEFLIRANYFNFMGIGTVFAGAGGVISDYSANMFTAVYMSIPQIVVFILPGVLFGIFGGKLTRFMVFTKRLVIGAVSFALAVVVFLLGVVSVNHGDYRGRYGSEYYFDGAVEVFGLATGLRLDLQNLVSGSVGEDRFSAGDDGGFVDIPETDGFVDVPDVGGFVDVPEDEMYIYENGGLLSGTAVFPNDLYARSTLSVDPADGILTLSSDSGSQKNNKSGNAVGYNVMDIDFDSIIKSKPNSTAAEISGYVKNLSKVSKNDYTGIFEGKNLILICAEALCLEAVDEELTPTLYRMLNNGIHFTDFYQPAWGGSTSTGEYSFVFGLVPTDGANSILKTAGNNNYFTLGNQLQRLGYTSAAYHNGTHTYYSRNKTHTNLGYSTFSAFGNGLENLMKKYASDTVLFDKTLDLHINSGKPFSLYYMSYSGHCAYNSSSPYVKTYLDKVNKRYGNKYKNTTKYYICYQMEFDNALKVMIDKLEAAGIADDTVIAICPDHYPYGLGKSAAFGNSQNYISDLYGYSYGTSWERDHSVCMIWSGCLENDLKDYACEITTPTYSLDLVPTLSNLFGVEYDARLLVGRDVFSNAEALVLWNNYSWVTERGKYDSAARKYYPKAGYVYDADYIARINAVVKNKIYYSKKAVECDYFAVLFGKDEVK